MKYEIIYSDINETTVQELALFLGIEYDGDNEMTYYHFVRCSTNEPMFIPIDSIEKMIPL